MQSMSYIAAQCQIEGMLKVLNKPYCPIGLKISKGQALNIEAKIRRMDKYLDQDILVLLNYILCIADDAGINLLYLQSIYEEYDPELKEIEAMEKGAKLAKRWDKILRL